MQGLHRLFRQYVLSALTVVLLAAFPFAQASTVNFSVVDVATVDSGTGVMKRLSLVPYISEYVGEQTPDDIQQAAQLPSTAFEPVERGAPYLAAKKQWFRFFIHNNSNVARSLVLNLDQSLLQEVALQASVKDKVVKTVLTGQRYPYASRDLNYDFFAFRLDVPAGETMKVDFSIQTYFAAIFIPSLVSEDKFLQQITFDGRFAGSVMGMLYSIVFFLFIYVLYVRRFGIEFAMWLFAVMSLCSAMYMAGIFQRSIPDAYSEWRDIIYVWIEGLHGIAFAWLLCSYYRTAEKYRFMHQGCQLFGAVIGLCMLLVPWVVFGFLMQGLLIANTLLMVTGFVFSLWVLAAGREEKKLFSIGIVLFVVMTMLSTLYALRVPIPYVFGRYSYELGMTLEVDFLAVAVIARMLTAERERLEVESRVIKLNTEMQARSEFVDRVTHDVKSPLSAVVGAVHLLREPVSPEQRTKYLDVIQQSCNTVITIIDGILSYSRLSAGHAVLNKQPFSVATLLTEIENAFGVTYRQKNIVFSVSSSNSVPPLVVGDRERLHKVLNNLLTNAFKFTDEGNISLSVSVVAQSAEQVSLRFEVQDTGIGMSSEFISRAFDPYAREESHAGYRQGFGLGLPICKQIVDLLHGTIQISSSLGVGSVFVVELPFDLPQ